MFTIPTKDLITLLNAHKPFLVANRSKTHELHKTIECRVVGDTLYTLALNGVMLISAKFPIKNEGEDFIFHLPYIKLRVWDKHDEATLLLNENGELVIRYENGVKTIPQTAEMSHDYLTDINKREETAHIAFNSTLLGNALASFPKNTLVDISYSGEHNGLKIRSNNQLAYVLPMSFKERSKLFNGMVE